MAATAPPTAPSEQNHLRGAGCSSAAATRFRTTRGELSANRAVTQKFIKAQDDEKDKHMYDLLSNLPEGARVVAFANTKRRVETLSKTFWDQGFGDVRRARR